MHETPGTPLAPEGPEAPGQYEIRIQGQLTDQWAARFEGLTLTRDDNGTTLLTGPVVDQAALHGVLRQVRDLALPLLSVTRVRSDQGAAAASIPIKEIPA
jgi:hypothetical protein